MPNISIHSDSCKRCGACADICYARVVFEMGENGPSVVHPEKCRLCGHCVAVCPTGSIVHESIGLDDCPPVHPGDLPSLEKLVTALRSRRSCRRYRDRPVPRDIITQLISISRWIPTGENRQFLDWVVLDDRGKIDHLLHEVLKAVAGDIERGRPASKYLGDLGITEMNRLIDLSVVRKRRFFFNAPVVLAGYCEKNAYCAREEATYAAYNIALAAERMGLGTCHIGSIHLLLEEFTHLQYDILGIPEDCEVHTLLTLGYPLRPFLRMPPRRMPKITWNG